LCQIFESLNLEIYSEY